MGNLILEQENFGKVKTKTEHERGFLIVDPTLDLLMYEEDPKGVYKVEYLVFDNVSNKKVIKNYSFELN